MREEVPTEDKNTVQVKHVVILIHGIRDFGSWCQRVEKELASDAVKVYMPKFGWVSPLWFVNPCYRARKPMEEVSRAFVAVRQQFPDAQVSVVAHSFGTHLFTRFLHDHHDIRVSRVILCGSVVKQNYNWGLIADQIGPRDDPQRCKWIVNDCGSRDIWPAVGSSVAWWRYGNAGTDGFSSAYVTNRYHEGGHSLFFKGEFIRKYWKPFIEKGDIIAGVGEQGARIPCWVRILQKIPFIPQILMLLIGLLLVLVVVVAIKLYACFTSPKPCNTTFPQFISELKEARQRGPDAVSAFVREYEQCSFKWDCIIIEAILLDQTFRIAPTRDTPEEYQALAEFREAADVQSFREGQTATIKGTFDTVSPFAILLYDCRFMPNGGGPP